ncbi:MAG: anti-sigma F factor [Clostridia bacterium]|nr:anti-sigma F factor [Clostridia bacterium]
MDYINKMQLTIPALSLNESFARGVVGAFCVSINPTLEQINDLKTAVSEAVTNCVVHGYKNQQGNITIDAILFADRVEITITDFGVGIDNVEQAMQPFFTTKPDEERSGMGFTVMQAFMNKVVLSSQPGKGTKLKLTKFFKDKEDIDA